MKNLETVHAKMNSIYDDFSSKLNHGIDFGLADADDLVESSENIENWLDSRRNYNESGKLFKVSDNTIFVEDFQLAKGQRRQSIMVYFDDENQKSYSILY